MKRAALFTLLAGLLSAPAVAGITATRGDGKLSVSDARGLVWVQGRGAAIGRLDRGSITVTDLTPADSNEPLVFGCNDERFRGAALVCKGENVRYRLIGGMWRISVLGRGIDLSAVAKGRVLLDGDGLRTGVYSTKGVDCRTEPEECETVPEDETSFVLGTVR